MRCYDLKQKPYAESLALQKALVAQARCSDKFEDTALLVEHVPPVITYGRRAKDEHVLVSPEMLAGRGVETHAVTRGGDVTWHGPGQQVVYCVRRLDRRSRSVHDHVARLEETVILLLDRYGIEGYRREGMTGVWAAEKKVAAVGVAVSHWVCYHGMALNVGPDLSGFDLIVPCGIKHHGVTSLSKLLERECTLETVKPDLLDALSGAFDTELHGGDDAGLKTSAGNEA